MAGAIGGLVGSVVSSLVSSVVSSVMSSMISSLGSGNILGALTNVFMGALGTAFKGIIENSPLPPFLKQAASAAIDKGFSGQQPTTPAAQDAVNQNFSEQIMSMAQEIANEAGKEADKKSTGGSGGWLIALANAMAKIQGEFMDKAMKNLDKMEGLTGKDDGSKFMKEQGEYQANMKMFGMMAEASSTALKTVGDAMMSLSRKQ